jgi:aminoglycoside 2'-N-acetyltransferase I
MTDTIRQHIELIAGPSGLKPRIAGHRIRVQDIAIWHEKQGMSPDEAGQTALRTAYVDAVATEPDLWGQGIGSAVLERLIQETLAYALVGRSTRRVSFYQRLGWERWRGPLAARTEGGLVDTPDETVLNRCTPLSPPLDLDSLLTVEWRPGQPW